MRFTNKYLSEVVFFQEGPGVRKFQFRNEGVKLLNVGNINKGILDTSTTKLYISEEEAYSKYKHFLIDDGDLLIASSGIVVDNFHNKIAYVRKDNLPLCLNTSTIRFKTLDEKYFNLDYLKFYLKTNHFKNQLRKLITGAAQLNFGPSHLKKSRIPDKPTRKESIRLLDEFLKSTFLELFGDPANNVKGWKLEKLGLITYMKSGQFVAASDIESEFNNKLYPCYGGNGLRGYTKSFTHNGEFVLIGRQGALCGNVKIAKGKFHATEHAVVCSPIMNYETSWLYYLLDTINLNKYATGVAQPGLAVGKLEQIYVSYPPFSLQTQFALIVGKTEALKTQYYQSLLELENLYGSLSQKAFRGELSFKEEGLIMAAEPEERYSK
jgi:type I restriction enzyme S subunit